MSGAAFLDLSTLIALVLLGFAAALTLIRLLRGPTLPDRILALDTLTTLAASGIAIFALRTALLLYVDLAIALALMGFLSTAAFARYIFSRRGEEPR